MSVRECITKLVAAGKITKALADEALGLHERAKGEFSATMGPASAEAAAALAVARDMEAGAKKLKYQASKQALAWANFERRTLEHEKGPVAGVLAQLTRDIWEKGGENVATKTEVIWSQLSRMFETAMKAYSPGILGQGKEQIAGVKRLVQEVFGVDTGDQVAKAGAKGWRAAVDESVDRARAAGRNFEPNEDWRVPQFWDAARLRGWTEDQRLARKAEFKRDLMQEVDRDALALWDRDTNRPAAKNKYEFILDRAYRDITSGGGTTGTFSQEMRTFQFTDGQAGADAWLRLQGKYGPGDNVMGLLTGHLHSMARDTALAEVIGPNHGAIIRAGMEYVREHEGALPTSRRVNPLMRALESAKTVERTYDVLTGRANAVEGPLMAGILGGLRSISTAAQLKGAIISSVPGDSVTAAFASSYNGMAPTRILSGALRELARGGEASRDVAARLNLTAHSAMEYSHGYRFFQDQIAGPETLRALATTMIRAQGLQAWTELIKRTFSMEFMGHLADHAGNTLDELRGVNAPLSRFLERHQFNAEEWDHIRDTKPLNIDGAKFLDTTQVAPDLREKLLGAVIEERAFAMLEPDARIRAITTGGLPSGTFMGEVARNLFLFKSFSLSMAATHMMRLATQGPIESRIWNATLFTLFSGMAGAATIQAKNILYGKDPETMSSAAFWGKSLITGGGMGIYGDLINSSFSRSGRSPLADIAGPIAGVAEDAARLSSGQLRKLYEGGDTTLGAEAVRTARRYTPGTFYTKLAVDRIMFDQLQTLADPDYRASFRRMEKRMKDENGQEFWWRPGRSPERGPNLGAAAQ